MIAHAGELLRVVNVALTIATAAGLFVRVSDLWGHLVPGQRLVMAGVVLFPVAVAVGSSQSQLRHALPTIGTPLITAACCLVLTGLWLSRGTDPTTRSFPA